MPPELAPFILDLVWPLLGVMTTGLLTLLTWIANRANKKLDDICAQLQAGHTKFAEHEKRIACIETRCRIFHKED